MVQICEPEDHLKGRFTTELNLLAKGNRYLYSPSERYPHGRPDHPIIGSRGEHTAPALRSIKSSCSVFRSSALDPRVQEEFVQFQKKAESGSGPPHCHIPADTATGKGEIFVVVHGVPPDRSGRQTPQFVRAALMCKLLVASPTEASGPLSHPYVDQSADARLALVEVMLILGEEPSQRFTLQTLAALQRAVEHCAPKTSSVPSLFNADFAPWALHTEPIREGIPHPEAAQASLAWWQAAIPTLQVLWKAYNIPASLANVQRPLDYKFIFHRDRDEEEVLAEATEYSLAKCLVHSTNRKLKPLGLSSDEAPGSRLMFLTVNNITPSSNILEGAACLGSSAQVLVTAGSEPWHPTDSRAVSTLTVTRLDGSIHVPGALPSSLYAKHDGRAHTGASLSASSQMLRPSPPCFTRMPDSKDAKCSTLAYVSRQTARLKPIWQARFLSRSRPRRPPSAIDLEPQEHVNVG